MSGIIQLDTLLTNALAFSVAFAFNDAIKKSLDTVYPKDTRNDAIAAIIYAIIVILLIIFIVHLLNEVKKGIEKWKKNKDGEMKQ